MSAKELEPCAGVKGTDSLMSQHVENIFIPQLFTEETTAHPLFPAVKHLAGAEEGVSWGNQRVTIMPFLPRRHREKEWGWCWGPGAWKELGVSSSCIVGLTLSSLSKLHQAKCIMND